MLCAIAVVLTPLSALAQDERDTAPAGAMDTASAVDLAMIEGQVEVHLSSGKTIRGRIIGIERGRMRLELGPDDLAIVPMSLVVSYNPVDAAMNEDALEDKVTELADADAQRSRDLEDAVLDPEAEAIELFGASSEDTSGGPTDPSDEVGEVPDPNPEGTPRRGADPFARLEAGDVDMSQFKLDGGSWGRLFVWNLLSSSAMVSAGGAMILYRQNNRWVREEWNVGGLATHSAGTMLANAGVSGLVAKQRGMNTTRGNTFAAASVGTLAGLGGYVLGLMVFVPIYNNTFAIENTLGFADAYNVALLWGPAVFGTLAAASVTTVFMANRHKTNSASDAAFKDASAQSELNLRPRWSLGLLPTQGGATFSLQARF